jgi:hypothetical protein
MASLAGLAPDLASGAVAPHLHTSEHIQGGRVFEEGREGGVRRGKQVLVTGGTSDRVQVEPCRKSNGVRLYKGCIYI